MKQVVFKKQHFINKVFIKLLKSQEIENDKLKIYQI